MKFFQEYCTICGKVVAMPVVQEDDSHPGLIWVRCPSCQEIKPIETESKAVKKSAKEAGPAPQSGCAPEAQKRAVRHYRAGEKFEAGEWIYHPEWRDTGMVIEKLWSTGGREIIVVAFEKMGKKRLVNRFAC